MMTKKHNLTSLGIKSCKVSFLGDKLKNNLGFNLSTEFIKESLKKVYKNIQHNYTLTTVQKEMIYNLVPSPQKTFSSTGDLLSDVKHIYETVENALKTFVPKAEEGGKCPLRRPFDGESSKKTIYSYGEDSIRAEYLAVKHNLKHICFNPWLFKTNSTVYKIKGCPYSLFCYGPNVYEIDAGFKGLDNKANDLKNFE